MMDDTPDDIKASIYSFLTVKERLCVVSLLSKQWHGAVGHLLVWENVDLAQKRRTNSFMQHFAAFFTSRNVCPQALTGVDLFNVTSVGVEHLFLLSNVCRLDLSGLHHRHTSVLERQLPHFPNLTDLRLGGSWDALSLPVMPRLRHLAVESPHGAVAGVGQQHSLTCLSITQDMSSYADFPQSLRQLTLFIKSSPHGDPLAMINDRFHLPDLEQLTTRARNLFLSHNNSLSLRFQCANLSSLRIYDDYVEYRRIECIAHELRNIRTLDISSSNMSGASMRALGTMTSLESLSLRSSEVIGDDNMQPLSNLYNMRVLVLGAFARITEHCLSHIASLPSLSEIELVNCRSITGVSPLRRCVGLRSIHVWNPGSLLPSSFVSSLSSLRSLQSLQLYFKSSPTDQDMSLLLSTLRNLRSLEIKARETLFSSSSLALLPNLSSLERLTLPLPLHTPSDLSVCIDSLCHLHNMRYLSLTAVGQVVSALESREEWEKMKEHMEETMRSALPRLELCDVCVVRAGNY